MDATHALPAPGRTRALAVILAVLAAVLAMAAGTARAEASSYVALGDSYTSAPLVLPVAAGAPLICTQSARNYPHLAATELGLALTDRSCAGADTGDMTASQYPGVGPQFDALGADTQVVSLGIGGNDDGLFLNTLVTCVAIDALNVFDIGAPCRSYLGDAPFDTAAAIGPRVGTVIQGIQGRSPDAKVFVVGYPAILPEQGRCYPRLPLTTGDVAYTRRLEVALNAAIADAAAANGATYVDTYTPSIGHDACKAESTRWVEPVVPGTDAITAHPNAAGEAATAATVVAAMRGAGVGSGS